MDLFPADSRVALVQLWIFALVAALFAGAAATAVALAFRLRRARVAPKTAVDAVLARVRDGDIAAAAACCEERPCAFSALALAVFDSVRAAPEAPREMLRDVVQGEGTRIARRASARVRRLHELAVLAALAGMLGTALGLFSAVPGLSGPSPAARSALLADGLAQALATTVAGLAVALPSYLLHAVFRRRLERLSDELESAAQQLLGALWLQRLL